jgi:hypothetical protein
MHFSLRTLLVATTAVAVYIGFHFGMIRTFHGRTALNAPGLFGMLYHLPLFIIWSVAAANIYPVRRKIPHANLVLAAILLAFAWQLTSPFAQLVFFRFLQSGDSSFQSGGASLVSTNALRWYGSAFALLEGVVEAMCWGLILYAYVKTSALVVDESSSGLPTSGAS